MEKVYINIGTKDEPNFKKGKIINFNNINKICDVQIMLDNKSYAKDDNGILLFTVSLDMITEEKPKILRKVLIREPRPIEDRIDIDKLLKELE